MIWKKQGRDGQSAPLSRLVLLSLFFLGGIFLGQVLSGRVPEATGDELGRYLTDYLRLDNDLAAPRTGTVLSTAVIYFRYPLVAFLLGFTSLGVLLLPITTAAFGFFLSFSICCFTASFGSEGVLLALAVFGLRCTVTLPCYLLLAVPAWGASAALASLSFGQGRRVAPVNYGRHFWLRSAGVMAVLFVGVCGDVFLSPWLLHLVLERILA